MGRQHDEEPQAEDYRRWHGRHHQAGISVKAGLTFDDLEPCGNLSNNLLTMFGCISKLLNKLASCRKQGSIARKTQSYSSAGKHSRDSAFLKIEKISVLGNWALLSLRPPNRELYSLKEFTESGRALGSPWGHRLRVVFS